MAIMELPLVAPLIPVYPDYLQGSKSPGLHSIPFVAQEPTALGQNPLRTVPQFHPAHLSRDAGKVTVRPRSVGGRAGSLKQFLRGYVK